MGVTTTADEHLGDAKDAVKRAIASLSQIVVEECWGADEFTEEYREKMRQSFYDLLAIRDRLK